MVTYRTSPGLSPYFLPSFVLTVPRSVSSLSFPLCHTLFFVIDSKKVCTYGHFDLRLEFRLRFVIHLYFHTNHIPMFKKHFDLIRYENTYVHTSRIYNVTNLDFQYLSLWKCSVRLCIYSFFRTVCIYSSRPLLLSLTTGRIPVRCS